MKVPPEVAGISRDSANADLSINARFLFFFSLTFRYLATFAYIELISMQLVQLLSIISVAPGSGKLKRCGHAIVVAPK